MYGVLAGKVCTGGKVNHARASHFVELDFMVAGVTTDAAFRMARQTAEGFRRRIPPTARGSPEFLLNPKSRSNDQLPPGGAHDSLLPARLDGTEGKMRQAARFVRRDRFFVVAAASRGTSTARTTRRYTSALPRFPAVSAAPVFLRQ